MLSEDSVKQEASVSRQKRKRDTNKAHPKKKTKLHATKVSNGASDAQKPDETTFNEDEIDESIAKMDSSLLADFVAQKARKHNEELTPVELSDMYLPENSLRDTSEFELERKLPNLPSFFSSFQKSALGFSSQAPGSPSTLVVTSAGLRAADISRALRVFQTKDLAVAKLFAKHIKLKDAVEYVKKTNIGIGIGTPVRLADLLESGALRLGGLRSIVIDGSYIDQKKRSIFDMKETFLPLLQLLNREEIRDRFGAAGDSKIEILVF